MCRVRFVWLLVWLLLFGCKAMADIPVYTLPPSELTNCDKPVILGPVNSVEEHWYYAERGVNPGKQFSDVLDQVRHKAESMPGASVIAGFKRDIHIFDETDNSNVYVIAYASGVVLHCEAINR